MIRIGLPIPIHWRLRPYMAAPPVERSVTVQPRRRHQATVSAWLESIPWLARRRAVSRAAALMHLRLFDQHYQRLVDVLCGAAREGVAPFHRERYSELRTWFLENYDVVRPGLSCYLRPDDDDGDPVLGAPRRPRDAFESLFLPVALESLINSATVISRIQRTRGALESCLDDAEAART